MASNEVQNPGSALGEALGWLLENEVHSILKPLAEKHGYHYITTAGVNPKTGSERKLLLQDNDGISYNIDAVILNDRFQPLVIVESKYLRYKKHNRDKASWICTAHSQLRQRYSTIRRSIAVLMGSWSKSSKQLIHNFDTETFEIEFDTICDYLLEQHDIRFHWGEKDRDIAVESWQKFCKLSQEDQTKLAKELIAQIEPGLRDSLETALDDSVPSQVSSATVLVKSSRGETFRYAFPDLEKAIVFLQKFDPSIEMDTSNAPAVLNNVQMTLDSED